MRTVVEASVILHEITRIKLPAIGNAEVDHEYAYNKSSLVLGEMTSRYKVILSCVRNRDLQIAKIQRDYLKGYFNSPAVSVVW